MEKVIGNTYFYQTNGGTIKQAKLIGETKAWLKFDNGDWIKSYNPIYETKEDLVGVNNLVEEMYKNTYIPDTIHFPNRFTWDTTLSIYDKAKADNVIVYEYEEEYY